MKNGKYFSIHYGGGNYVAGALGSDMVAIGKASFKQTFGMITFNCIVFE